ncbi:MAG: pentapeptide repeat-containing protein [Hyphomicrobiaceae bacterium]|nr:MAG: pentapeptide repeat-containing protein [Hyphomicrobiaceae bacterium]
MNESSRAVIDTETPVNPYSLLEAVNRSSDTVNTAWLIFLGLMSYLLVTVAGITHKDLLLNTDIALPILQVKIDLTRFFLFAPILLVLFHMGVIGQLVLLARKTLEFAAAIRMLEISDQRTHPLRLELDNFFFVQAVAGPERSRIMSIFLHGMSWLTLVLLPLLLLLYVQVVFLPYHDATITWMHRLAVLADIALLIFIGVFLLRSETSFFRAFLRTSRHHPLSLLLTAAVFTIVAVFSLFIATIPGEAVDRISGASSGGQRAAGRDGGFVFGYAVPALGSAGDGAVLGLFHRNLNVTDLDLVVDKDVTPGEPTLNLRGRDLRFARLDRTDLHQADMTGSELDGASFVGADLRNVWVQCSNLDELLLTDDRRAARCASARGVNFSKARLAEARMIGIDLRGARLEEAQMQGAVLAHGLMAGADFAGARLDRADLTGGVSLQGANFLLASLQGADLTGAKLQVADFSNAGLQGANLSIANLEGAVLRDAELEGASMQLSKLHGANFSGARMQGTDLAGASVWRTQPPAGEGSAFSDMSQIIMRAPSEEDLASLKAAYASLDSNALRKRISDGLSPLLDAGQNATWASSTDQQLWQEFAKASETALADAAYKARLTDYLTRLICRPRFANGAVATGVARRAMAHGFKGDMPAIYDKLKAPDCPAAPAMSPRVMRELATAAEAARAQ